MSEEDKVRILRRDILLLSVLAACAVGLFLLTKAVAAREGKIETRVAATWYKEGELRFRAGAVESSIEPFRKATEIDLENRTYVLALADALAAANHNEEAEEALVRLRERDPANAEVNLHLARLAAKRGNIEDTVLYYHSSLDGMWVGPDVAEQRRNIRIELIHFLIDRHDQNRALSELLDLDGELPDTSDAHVQAAKLFLKADGARHALNDFSQAIRLSPHNAEALAGAGEAEFRLGDYRSADDYLEQANAQGQKSPETLQLLSLVRMVTSYDPLAPNLTPRERQQRLLSNLDQSTRRLDQCDSSGTISNLEALRAEADAMRTKVDSAVFFRDPGLITSGLGLIYRIEDATNARCGEAEGANQALLLIARKHGNTQ